MEYINQNQLLKQYLMNMQAHITDADLTKVPRHWGNMNFTPELHKFYLILDGEGWLNINGRDYYPKPGELFLIPSGVRQSHATTSDDTFLMYWCHFTATIGDMNLFDVIKMPYSVDVEQTGDIGRITQLFQDLLTHYNSDHFLSGCKLKSLLLDLFYSYWTHSGIDTVHLSGTISHEKIHKVIKYIHDHLTDNITVEDLAKLVHLHPNHFTHMFKNMLGFSPTQYIIKLKMEKAKTMLASSKLSITEIAEKIGLELHYFSRLFKNHVGFSPSEYKKAEQRKGR